MTWRTWFGTLAAGLLLAQAWACGGDTESGDGGNGGSGATSAGGQAGSGASTGGSGGSSSNNLQQRYCNGDYARDQQCGNEPTAPADCLTADGTACIFEVTRPEIIEELVTCLIERPCDEIDDVCFYEVGAASPTTGQSEYMADCTTKRSACSGGFADDWCAVTIVTTEMYAALSACLELACDQVADCIAGLWPDTC